jgi:hypothetical protein
LFLVNTFVQSFVQFITESSGVKWVPGCKNWTSISGQKHEYHVEHRPLNSLHGTDITYRHRVKKLVDHVKKGGDVDMMEVSPKGEILDGHHRHKMSLKFHKPTDSVPVQVHTVK